MIHSVAVTKFFSLFLPQNFSRCFSLLCRIFNLHKQPKKSTSSLSTRVFRLSFSQPHQPLFLSYIVSNKQQQDRLFCCCTPVTRKINSMNIHTTASWHRPPSTTTKYNKKNIFFIHKTQTKTKKELNLKHWKKVSFFFVVVRVCFCLFCVFFLLCNENRKVLCQCCCCSLGTLF